MFDPSLQCAFNTFISVMRMTSPPGFMNRIRVHRSITVHKIFHMALEYHLWLSTIKLGYVSVRVFWASWHAEFQPTDSV
jgi:hypothetical protein